MTKNQEIVWEACYSLLQRAIAQYGLSEELAAHDVKISFDLKGRTGGQAVYHGFLDFELRFNIEAVEEHLDFVLKDIVPHEIAHIICKARPHLGKNHNKGWVRVCQRLGGSGDRTHPLPLTKARNPVVQRHIYEVRGERIELSTVRHNRIQRGQRSYSVNLFSGREQIHAYHYQRSYSIKR